MNKEEVIKAFLVCHSHSDSDPCVSCPFALMGENCSNLEANIVIILKELIEENNKLKVDIVQKMTDRLKKRLPVISPSVFDQIAKTVLEESGEQM